MIPFLFHYLAICPDCGKENRVVTGATVGFCKFCKKNFIVADVPFTKTEDQ